MGVNPYRFVITEVATRVEKDGQKRANIKVAMSSGPTDLDTLKQVVGSVLVIEKPSGTCRCGHPADAHDAGECWTRPDAYQHPAMPCPCGWYDPKTPAGSGDHTPAPAEQTADRGTPSPRSAPDGGTVAERPLGKGPADGGVTQHEDTPGKTAATTATAPPAATTASWAGGWA